MSSAIQSGVGNTSFLYDITISVIFLFFVVNVALKNPARSWSGILFSSLNPLVDDGDFFSSSSFLFVASYSFRFSFFSFFLALSSSFSIVKAPSIPCCLLMLEMSRLCRHPTRNCCSFWCWPKRPHNCNPIEK